MTKELNQNDAPAGYIAKISEPLSGCIGCAFRDPKSTCGVISPCTGGDRNDGHSVIFVKRTEATPTPAVAVRSCWTCLHSMKSIDEDPCNECDTPSDDHSKWEPLPDPVAPPTEPPAAPTAMVVTHVRLCSECKRSNAEDDARPCVTCIDSTSAPNWEPATAVDANGPAAATDAWITRNQWDSHPDDGRYVDWENASGLKGTCSAFSLNWDDEGRGCFVVRYRFKTADIPEAYSPPAEPAAALLSVNQEHDPADVASCPVPTHEVRTVEWVHATKGKAIFDPEATHIKIDDEGAGEFVVVSQHSSMHEGAGSIRFDAIHWPSLRAAIDAAVSACRG